MMTWRSTKVIVYRLYNLMQPTVYLRLSRVQLCVISAYKHNIT